MSNYEYDAIIIGGGPAGLMCAGTAARRGLRVLLCEQGGRTARKLRITGKGRCNVTNNCSPEELLRNFIKTKRAEVAELNKIPHPAEFEKYYNL